MSTKKTVSKKAPAKKEVAPKPVVTKKSKSEERRIDIINKEAKVKLTSFTVRMTIPIQQYGNVQPEITVTAPNIESALNEVMPVMEKLYQTYAEPSREGKIPAFFNKANVTVTEKKVDPETVPAPKAEVTAPVAPKTEAPAPAKEEEKVVDGPAEKTPAYLKAENAIATSMSTEALDKVGEAIEKSVKISDDVKHFLIIAVLKKHKELNAKK